MPDELGLVLGWLFPEPGIARAKRFLQNFEVLVRSGSYVHAAAIATLGVEEGVEEDGSMASNYGRAAAIGNAHGTRLYTEVREFS